MSEMCSDLSSFLIGRGAALVGFADLAEVPAEDRASMRYGVSIAAALAPGIVAGIRGGPTAEYRAEYDRVNEFLGRLADGAAEVLEKNGHRAVPRAATHEGIDWERLRTALPHKTVATRAGLGWIGKCAVLVTPEYGSAVRITTVLTDAELDAGLPVDGSRCGECSACVEVCPARAVSGVNWVAGMARQDFFDAFACRDSSRRRGEKDGVFICGMCIAACPWTMKYLEREGAA